MQLPNRLSLIDEKTKYHYIYLRYPNIWQIFMLRASNFIKKAWKIQKRLESRGFRLKNIVLKELENYSFKKTDQILFFAIFLICYFVGTYILFHVEIYKSFLTDYWILPFGVGSVSLFFFLIQSNLTKEDVTWAE